MRFYLASWIGDGHGENEYRPSVGEGAWAGIDLRPDATRPEGRVLVATPEPLATVPRGVLDLGDLDESMPRGVSRKLETDLGVTLDQTDRLRSIVAELLILHGDNRTRETRTRWRPLKQDRRGWHRIRMLGETLYEAPAPVGTVITETWPVPDSTNPSGTHTWTEVILDSATSGWEVENNRIVNEIAGNFMGVRCETDLAGDDHYAEAEVVDVDWLGTSAYQVCVRFEAAASTCYMLYFDESDNIRLQKTVATSRSQFASNDGVASFVDGDVLKLEVDGSALEAFLNDVSIISSTDTELTGQTRTGLGGNSTSGSPTIGWDNFTAEDLGAGGNIPVGQAREAETGQPITPLISRDVAVGQTTESETAQPITPALVRQVTLNPATEAETANPITVLINRNVTLGQAVEAETANTITPSLDRQVTVGQAVESETAGTINPVGANEVTVTTASEAETAGTITPATDREVTLGQATEAETAGSITPVIGRLVPIGTATEAETGNTLTPLVGQRVLIGQAAEVELARAISPDKPILVPLQTAVERELARVMTPRIGDPVVLAPPTCAVLSPSATCAILSPTVECEITNV